MKSKYKIYLATLIISFWYFQNNFSKVPNDNIRPTETMEQTQEDPSNQQKIGSLGEAIVSSLKDRNPLNLAMGNSSTETENTSSRLMQIEITNLPSSIDQLSFSEINNFLINKF